MEPMSCRMEADTSAGASNADAISRAHIKGFPMPGSVWDALQHL